MFVEVSAAAFVITHFRVSPMSRPIHFHDQFAITAGEVGDVWTYGKLPDEFETSEPAIADRLPKPAFGFGLIFSQCTGTFQ